MSRGWRRDARRMGRYGVQDKESALKGGMSMSESERRPLLVEIPFRVQTYDVDFAGVMSNIVYIRWLEDLRVKVLDRYLPLDTLLEQGISPILARTEINYRRSLRLDDRPVGRMWVSKIGRASSVLAAEFVLDDVIVADALQIGTFIKLDTGRPIPLPPKLRKQYDNWME
jgi:acyl-CoA thioester hydrolase